LMAIDRDSIFPHPKRTFIRKDHMPPLVAIEAGFAMFESYGKSVFKNRQALSFDYVPPKVVHRDAQLKRLATLFRPVLE